MSDKVFADGIIFKLPREGAPDFVKGSLSIKANEAIEWIKRNATNGWVNVDLKVGQSGKAYAELNTWKPKEKKESSYQNNDNFKDENIPF